MMTDRIAVRTVLEAGEHDYPRLARGLVDSLDARHFDVGRSGSVVLAASDRALEADEAVRLRDFVRDGGGLVVLHSTLAAWSGSEAIRELAGWVPGGKSRATELIVHASPDHALARGFAPEWAVTDEIFLSEGPPVDARIVLRTTWRFTDQVVAYERAYGEGRFVYIGLGHAASTYQDPTFRRLVARSLIFASGHVAPEPVGIGLIGYGAIARDHAAAIAATAGLKLAAVCDLSEQRRAAAAQEWSVTTHARQDELLRDAEVGLVVVGTPPVAHAESVMTALDAGKHVVCEKPFTLRVEDADRMIDAAASRHLTLTVYQSRRWDADYVAVRSAVRSGRIGDPFYMESFIGGYGHPCDFWHSHEPISGGMIYDWGSHYFDWILQLFDDRVVSVAAQSHKRVWHDVTNADQVRVELTFRGGAEASFLQSDIAAARKPKWYLLGTRGAIVADWADAAVPADLPARVTVYRSAEHGSDAEILSLGRRDDHGFYRNLAAHLAWDEPLAVPAEEARRNVAVMEAATRSIAAGGIPIKVEI